MNTEESEHEVPLRKGFIMKMGQFIRSELGGEVWVTTCPFCGGREIHQLTQEQMNGMKRNDFIQDIFPDSTPDEREFVLNGVHPSCWGPET